MAGDGATTMLAQARNALLQGDFAQAAQIAERVGRADPQTAEAWFVLGMALAETGHIGHALGQVQRAVDLMPGNAEYTAQLARLLIQLQRDAQARDVVAHAATLPTDDALVLDTIGCAMARLGAMAQRCRCLNAQCRRSPMCCRSGSTMPAAWDFSARRPRRQTSTKR